MNNSLTVIKDKIESIGYGLLRLNADSDQQLMTIAPSYGGTFDSLSCIIKERQPGTSLLSKEVRLIQKDKNDYLYISGTIDDEVKANCKVVFLKITKACWFTKRKRGNVAWLQEKHMYQKNAEKIERAS